MPSIRDIFVIWPTMVELANDLPTSFDRVRKWKKFGRIPQEHWDSLIVAAGRRGHELTIERIRACNKPMKPRGRPSKSLRRSKLRVEERAG